MRCDVMQCNAVREWCSDKSRVFGLCHVVGVGLGRSRLPRRGAGYIRCLQLAVQRPVQVLSGGDMATRDGHQRPGAFKPVSPPAGSIPPPPEVPIAEPGPLVGGAYDGRWRPCMERARGCYPYSVQCTPLVPLAPMWACPQLRLVGAHGYRIRYGSMHRVMTREKWLTTHGPASLYLIFGLLDASSGRICLHSTMYISARSIEQG